MMLKISIHFFVCLALGALLALGACSKLPEKALGKVGEAFGMK